MKKAIKKDNTKGQLSFEGAKVVSLERHLYAPELNTLHLLSPRGVAIDLRVPGKTSIHEALSYLFPVTMTGIYCRIKTHYDNPELKWLERVHQGFVSSRREALAFAAKVKAGLMETGTISVQTRLVG